MNFMERLDKVRELVDWEFWDYSWKYIIELTDKEEDYEEYSIIIEEVCMRRWTIILNVDKEWEIEVNIWEDTNEKIEYIDHSIKHFWIAFYENSVSVIDNQK